MDYPLAKAYIFISAMHLHYVNKTMLMSHIRV